MNIEYLLDKKPFDELRDHLTDEEKSTLQEMMDSSIQRYAIGLQQAADVKYIQMIGEKVSPYSALAALEGMEIDDNTKRIAYQSISDMFENREMRDYCRGKGNVPEC